MLKSAKIVLLLVAVVTAFASASLSQAATCGQGGSATNAAGSCETAGNDLSCGTGTQTTPAGTVTADPAGNVELCNQDGGMVPVEGRLGGGEDCQCIYADGGNDNDAPANGWARIDSGGLHCSTETSGPSYNSGAGGGPEACG